MEIEWPRIVLILVVGTLWWWAAFNLASGIAVRVVVTVLVLVVVGAFLWHPRNPNAALFLVGSSLSVALIQPFSREPMFVAPAVFYATYLVAADAHKRLMPIFAAWLAVGVGTGLILMPGIPAAFAGTPPLTRAAIYLSWGLAAAAVLGFTWRMGLGARARRERVTVLVESAQLARALERNRIAREMHDIIAHTLSGITALSDGARYAAGNDPALATAALDDISAESRRALRQIRELVSVLRTDDERDVLAAPGNIDLRVLVDQAKSRGLQLSVEGLAAIPADLDEMTQFTLYRITQELLSNMVRHADGECSLAFWVAPRDITVRASNAAASVGEGGFGLVGMSERARALGGSFSSGLRNGVYVAEAVLPR